jgi:hypothetical protein
MKRDFTFKMPTTAQGMMKQLTEWAKSLSKKERAEVRAELQRQLGMREIN